MKIVKLEAENVKRLSAVEITPDGSLVVIGGLNEAGKSSVLDSIEYALGGGDSLPSMPIRQGQKKAHVILDLGDIKVKRYFTKIGSRIEVSSGDGLPMSSPQAILDRLTGRLSFDPLEFARMKTKEQVETLKALVGLDFSALDMERKKAFDERTMVNRELKSAQVQLEAIAAVEAPDSEISISDLTSELEMQLEVNQENQKKRDEFQSLKSQIASKDQLLEDVKRRLESLKNETLKLLESEQKMLGERNALHATMMQKDNELKDLVDLPLEEIRQQIKGAEAINRKVRHKKERAERIEDLKSGQSKADCLSRRIDEIDSQKEQSLASAKFPIPDLSFSENGVTYKGIPFDQCSSAQQLRVSLSMGIALNSKLKVILIRDGSLLDATNLSLVAEMAEEAGSQVWLERVGEGKECSVIIEDGHVKEVLE